MQRFHCALICEAEPFHPSAGSREVFFFFFYVAAPLRAASEALSPVGAAAADGSAASWLAVAVRAEVLEGCCYVSPPSSLPASLSLSLPLYLSRSPSPSCLLASLWIIHI